MRAAPYHGRPLFAGPEEAVQVLRHLTGQDFGTDAFRWGVWLRANRWVYRADPPALPIKPEQSDSRGEKIN